MGTLTDVQGRALKFFSWSIALCSIVQASVSNFNLVEQRTITCARNVVRNYCSVSAETRIVVFLPLMFITE